MGPRALSLKERLKRHALPWCRRLYYRGAAQWRRLGRRIRYRRMPIGGWGRGWRLLVFRYAHDRRRCVHVLAPVHADQFDWEVLRPYVRGLPWPRHTPEPGQETGVIGWAGHHTYLVTVEFGAQRLSMGRLVPGEFGGGVDVGFLLVDVRDARLWATSVPSDAGPGDPAAQTAGTESRLDPASGKPTLGLPAQPA